MGEFYLVIGAIFLLGIGAGFLAGWARKNDRLDILGKIIWGFWIFLTCFNFPLWSERFPLKWHDVFTFVSTYGIIATAFHGIYGEDRGPGLYPHGGRDGVGALGGTKEQSDDETSHDIYDERTQRKCSRHEQVAQLSGQVTQAGADKAAHACK